jgi:hypothetical protein
VASGDRTRDEIGLVLPEGVTNFDDIDRNSALENVMSFRIEFDTEAFHTYPTIHTAEAYSLAAAQVATTRTNGIYCDSMSAI